MLDKYTCHFLLEIGVGTGRVANPLLKSGFDISGLDISRKMMEKARAKGVENLVLAEGTRVPFKDKIFDATIMAHVFHILPDPITVLHESARVSRVGVFALVRKGGMGAGWGYFRPGGWANEDGPNRTNSGQEGLDDRTKEFYEESRKRFRAISEKYGWSPESQRELHPRHWEREKEILEKYPPDDLMTVSDVIVNLKLEDRLARFEKNAYSYTLGMPEEMRQEIIAEIKANAARFPERFSQPRHAIFQLAMWRPDSLRN